MCKYVGKVMAFKLLKLFMFHFHVWSFISVDN